MSLDYFYYEELRQRKHRAACYWRIGDWLYYLGLLPAMLAVTGAIVSFPVGLFGFGWEWLLISVVTFVVGSVVFVIGSSLKGHAYTLGERDGIIAAEVYARGIQPSNINSNTENNS